NFGCLVICHVFLLCGWGGGVGGGGGLIQEVEVRTLNEMMVETQPAHLQHLIKRRLEAHERDTIRAEMVRLRMNASNG
ncbi:MAG: hypothetical protein O7G87_24220, partial [bacterium]|nr:hypothetical protein [bacterium]